MAAAFLAACYFSTALLKVGGTEFQHYLNSIFPALASLGAAGICLLVKYRACSANNLRGTWTLLATGLVITSVSQLLELAMGGGNPAIESLSIVSGALGFAAPWIFAIVGIDFYLKLRLEARERPLTDAAMAAASLALPGWYFIVPNFLSVGSIWTSDKILAPVAPFALAGCLFGAVALSHCLFAKNRFRTAPGFFALGSAAYALFGCVSAYLTSMPGVHAGPHIQWSDAAIVAASLIWGLSALWTLKDSARDWEGATDYDSASEPGSYSLFKNTVSYSIGTLSFVLTSLHEFLTRGGVSMGVVLFGFFVSGLALLRQIHTLIRSQKMLKDNELLTDKLRSVSESLEETVSQRTQQLHSLHQLTKAVNNTLEPEKVLSLTAVHTRAALHADAVVVWNLEKGPDGEGVLKGAIQIGLQAHPHLGSLIYQMSPSSDVGAFPLPPDPSEPDAPAGTLLRAPLMVQQKLIGMIGAIRVKRAFHRTDWEMLESIGFEAGTALNHARQFSKAIEAADVDPVTNLLNHRAIHQRFDDQLEIAAAKEGIISVMMMDMNNFKMFNDTYGHPAGDEALRRVARALADACRDRGFIGRYGGDEFLAILPNISSQEAADIARGVLDKLLSQGFMPNPQDGRVIPITLSFGIASYPQDSQSRHDIIAIADANLYSAKRSEGGIRQTSDSQRANRELKSEHSFAVLDGMVTAVDNKDSYTRRHSEDVAEYALWIAEEIGLSTETLRTVRIGALLHDVGKICVPDEILRKPGRLTPEEYEVLKRHPRLGALIVGGVPGMESILDIVQYHHERWDGRGYPDELKGEEIPLLGRLLAVADTFSAMTTDRPYRKGMDWTKAVEEIRVNSGTQFDPQLAQAFIRAVMKRRAAGLIPDASFGAEATQAEFTRAA